ncbi:MAG: multicopper oxidase domain-containing protein [Gammaproteobacteria bacterium]
MTKGKKVLTILAAIAVVGALGAWLGQGFLGEVRINPPATVAYVPPQPTQPAEEEGARKLCPITEESWRSAQTIEGVRIDESPHCDPDNPYEVAAVVKGTNNISMRTLMETRLASDAVIKGNDVDGDGDPDVIEIKLEVAELNGRSPDGDKYLPTYEIAPGVQPGLWVFAPKTRDMAAINLFSYEAIRDLRPPSPVIRVEQGDLVRITLENTHYLPHTIHLHGVDHPYIHADGNGNDGVPFIDQHPVLPGDSRSYTIQPRQPGTMFYHCHVQADKHLMMGLQGMFVVEENRPNNWVQTLNVGAGYVRHSSVAVKESYAHEYDLHYQSIDKELNSIIQKANDPRLIAQRMNNEYDITEATSDYFLLNGRSFPYTLRESIIAVNPDEKIKLRVLNGQENVLSLHTHGHKATITHVDGIEVPEAARLTRDVYDLSSAQRLDLQLNTTNDGLHNYGPGLWLFHNHAEKGVTTDGRSPGGDISLIGYRAFLEKDGTPKLQGMPIDSLLDPQYYAGKIPVWGDSAAGKQLGLAGPLSPDLWRLILCGLLAGLLAGLVGLLFVTISSRTGREA